MLKADVGNVNAPDVIGAHRRHISQQVQVNLVLRSGLARMGTRNQGENAHFAHVRLYGRARNTKFEPQQEGDFA